MCLNQQPVQSQPDLQCKRSCPGFPQTMQTQPPFQQPPSNNPLPPQNIQHQENPLIAEAMSRLFSNPSMKSILDPTTKLFNLYGLEIPRNGPCTNGPPQVINNYIIVPPEFLMEDKKSVVDKKPVTEKRIKKKNNNMNEGIMPQSQKTLKKNRGGSNVVPLDNARINARKPINVAKTTDFIRIEVQNPKDSSKSKPIKNHSQSSNIANKQIDSNTKTSKKTKNKQSRNNYPREEAVINDFKIRFPYIPEQVVRDLLNHMKRQLMNPNIGSPQTYYPQLPITFDQLYGNRFVPFPFTSVPDTNKKSITRTNSNNKQTKKRKTRVRNRKPKTTSTPQPCDDIVESTPAAEVTLAVANKIEATTVAAESTTEVPTTTTTVATTTYQVPTTAEMVTEPVIIDNSPEKEIHSIEATSLKYTESNSQENIDKNVIQNEVKIPELGSEDIVPHIYSNDLYDEYYPDFTGDLRYYSGEDFSYFSLEDDRYHYTTDKNFPLEELNRERRRLDAQAPPRIRRPQDRNIFRVPNRDKLRPNARPISQRRRPKFRTSPRPSHEIFNVTPRVKVIVKEHIKSKSRLVETNTEKPNSEEVQFRTPPTLEFIDFETKPINKEVFFHNDYKSSSYSDMKTPQYISEKNVDKSKKLDQKQKLIDKIQTDFAGSKVATYGIPVFVDVDLEKDEISKEDKVIVMAQTVNSSDYW
ncbi:hypothetical protein O0L34_g13279 [Tuta absoluta]|nr:hypothetical protein O0L34_g13279 [Tuta absoluta]